MRSMTVFRRSIAVAQLFLLWMSSGFAQSPEAMRAPVEWVPETSTVVAQIDAWLSFPACECENEVRVLRKELEETREARDLARREVLELRHKLKDLTSIEKSMDERKGH